MTNQQKCDLNIFNQSIIKTLILDYNMNKLDAEKAVNNSVLQPLFHKYSDIVMHYAIEYWAKDIYNECNHLPIGD